MSDIKQVIVMRHDLQMRKGKMIAQGAHASMLFLLDDCLIQKMSLFGGRNTFITPISEIARYWIENSFTKICVRVESEEELFEIHQRALDAGLVSHLVTDKGLTEFDGVPTHTCCAIGPDEAEKIDEITGGLKLL